MRETLKAWLHRKLRSVQAAREKLEYARDPVIVELKHPYGPRPGYEIQGLRVAFNGTLLIQFPKFHEAFRMKDLNRYDALYIRNWIDEHEDTDLQQIGKWNAWMLKAKRSLAEKIIRDLFCKYQLSNYEISQILNPSFASEVAITAIEYELSGKGDQK